MSTLGNDPAEGAGTPPAKAPKQRRKRAGSGRRRWLVPPAMLGDRGVHMSELGILAEHGRYEALLLWNLARDFTLWATAPEEVRPDLFPLDVARARRREIAASRLPADVATWLDLLVSAVYGAHAAPETGVVTDACTRLVAWASRERQVQTALCFAQVAALAEPLAPRAALLVGATAAEFAAVERAESWLQRAVAIARRVLDWRTYAECFLRLGHLACNCGRQWDADQHYKRALKAARRWGYRAEVSEALTGLVRAAVDAGRFPEAERWYHLAAKHVGRDDAGKAKLLRASIELWIWQGNHERALLGLESQRLEATTPELRMETLSRIAVVAAAAGNTKRLREAWTDAWELAQDSVLAPAKARFRTFLNLHGAAEAVGDAGRAARALRAASEHASSAADQVALDSYAALTWVTAGAESARSGDERL